MTECNPGKHVKRVFLKENERESIINLAKQGFQLKDIVKITRFKTRKVSDILNQYKNNQTNEWSSEEVDILKNCFINGIQKPSILKKYLPKKADWMIRNKIKIMKKENRFDDSEFSTFYTSIPAIASDNQSNESTFISDTGIHTSPTEDFTVNDMFFDFYEEPNFQ